jgi:hypothetical protein
MAAYNKEASADRRRTFGSNRLPAGGEGIRTGGSTTNLSSRKKAESQRGLFGQLSWNESAENTVRLRFVPSPPMRFSNEV